MDRGRHRSGGGSATDLVRRIIKWLTKLRADLGRHAILVLVALLSPMVARLLYLRRIHQPKIREEAFSVFLEDLSRGKLGEVLIADDHLDVITKIGHAISSYRTRPAASIFDKQSILQELTRNGVVFSAKHPSMWKRAQSALLIAFPFAYLACIYYVLKSVQNPRDSVGRRAKQQTDDSSNDHTTFNDVAGVDGAKAELMDVLAYLKDPSQYAQMGARLPKGILLSGPAGTGKTMMARAMANEVKSSFIVVSASEFVETLVGRGAKRVRDLFARARKQAPCIVFIDEIDCLGRTRGSSLSSHEEREQTLNQLLTEMDGFEGGVQAPVLVIAATNRPEVMDPALLRPGRFDRHVRVPLPARDGRHAILSVHTRGVRLDPDGVDLHTIAQQTHGMSGADLANIVNEAALLAVREGSQLTFQRHLEEAVRRQREATATQPGSAHPQFFA